MQASDDHFLLYTEAHRSTDGAARWKFVLQSVDSNERFAATDSENEPRTSRLELLAVVRGLEALDRPVRVTLLTRSRYVSRGIRRQLATWREDNWQWERFGQMVPIRDHDLWQRVDRALEFHSVECRSWHAEGAEAAVSDTATSSAGSLFASALATLGRGVLTPLTALWRPTANRAA